MRPLKLSVSRSDRSGWSKQYCGLSLSFLLCLMLTGCSESSKSEIAPEKIENSVDKPNVSQTGMVPVQPGDMARSGGSPTIRRAFKRSADHPGTTNDESNDQPVGHFGTVTLSVLNVSSGNTYSLDADVSGGEVERIYFPKGGWVDFVSSDIDSSGNGSGIDEKGNHWEFEGYDSGSITTEVEDEDSDEKPTAEEE